jgi:pectin methylesterase-like acyl-CoA thioesterase
MKKLTPCLNSLPLNLTRNVYQFFVLFVVAFSVTTQLHAATILWTGRSGTDTNWSTPNNWTNTAALTAPVPTGSDDVVFGNTGAVASSLAISNYIDSTSGNFLGTVGSLSFTNNVNSTFQNTLIAPGLTLTITNNTGPFGSLLFVGTPTAAAAGASMFASISGPGAALNLNNTNGILDLSQSGSSSSLGTLLMTNLDTFTANINKIAIGDFLFGVGTVAAQGSLFLAKTNFISTAWVGVHSNPYGSSAQPTNAIQLGVGSSSTLGGINAMFLGLTNGIFTDSIGVGGVKSGGSAASPALMAFAPVFTNSSPTAYFRGISGNSSRIAQWGVGDTAIGSGSSAQCFGKVDFSNGSIDALVDTLILGRDRNGTAPLDAGVFSFTAGKLDVNNLFVGNQGSSSTGSACSGILTVNGPTAGLTVNQNLVLGLTTLTGGPANALNTSGVLNVFNGSVNASNIVVGASSITNIIALNNAVLTTSNSLATNASGLRVLAMTNSTLTLPVTLDALPKVLVQTLTTGGTTNLVQLTSVPVFPSYPTQFPLIKYTAINGAGFNLGLAGIPVTAPGAFLKDNLAGAINLVLPASPAPVITAQPLPVSGDPGNTATFSVTIAPTSVTPLSYQWFYTNGVSTTQLFDGPGPSGSSTLTGTATNSLTVTSSQVGDSGGYFVVITNVYGSVTSLVAQLRISTGDLPPIVVAANTQSTIQGTNTVITDYVSAKPAPDIRWQFNGADLTDGPGPSGLSTISGSTTTSLTIINPQYPGDQGTYSLIASNIAGMATNSTFLTVYIPPVITNQPVSRVVTNGNSASFTVLAGGVPNPTYQWTKNGVPISNLSNPSATNATFTIAATTPADTAIYAVVISNPGGTVTSSNATLTVNSSMSVTSVSPANGSSGLCYDTLLSVTFSVPPVLNNIGTIKIFNVTNPATPVDTITLSLGNPQGRVIGGVTLNAFAVSISGNTATLYPHSGVMTSNQTYYVTIDDGAFKDSAGAYFAGITDTNAWKFSTKPGGPANVTNIVVASDNTGDFLTVQGALDSIPGGNSTPTLINLRNGTYTEINRLNSKSNITILGQDRHKTVIAYANNDTMNGGTANRPMFGVLGANDVAIENLTLTNTTPKGGSQAEALYVNVCQRFICYFCDIGSYQDTVLVNANGDRDYFQDNSIRGDTDFIWGSGTAFFTNCEIQTLTSGSAANLQNITQPRTSAGTNGFSFVNCQLTRRTNSTFGGLGRSLGFADGNAAYIHCLIDLHIVGWQDPQARYWEFGNSNLTAAYPTNFNGVQLATTDPNLTNAMSAPLWLYGWQPQLAPNILTNPANQNVAGSGTISLAAFATGIPSPSYQWFKDGNALNGQTAPTLTIPNANVNNSGSYSVVVSNIAGVLTSTIANVVVSNSAPTLAAIPSTTNNVGVTVSVTPSATDPDSPPQTLHFNLVSGPFTTFDTNSGAYTWRPQVTDSGTVNTIQIAVIDNGSPNLSATQSFVVAVNPLTQPTVSAPAYAAGQFSLTVDGQTGPDYEVLASSNLTDWVSLVTNTSPTMPFLFTDPNAASYPLRFYRIVVGPPPH